MITNRKKSFFRKLIKYLIYTILISLVIILVIVLIPKRYNIPAAEVRKGTLYWDLNTGSHIAYYHIPSKGNKKLAPIIYLHGGPGGQIFDLNIEVLSSLSLDGHDIYLYDQVGGGLSSRLSSIESYSYTRHKKDLEQVVSKITSDKVILIGQSWGAVLACLYIADNPSKVEKLIMTGPGPIFPNRHELRNIPPPDSLHLIKPLFTNRQGREKVYNLRAYFVEAVAKTLNIKIASDKEMDAFASLLSAEMSKSTVCDTSLLNEVIPGAGYYNMIKTMQSLDNAPDDIREKLVDCTNPVLILRGQCDGIPWGFINEYTQVFRNCRIQIIPGAGHSIAREQPERYLQEVKGFLEGER